MSPILVRPVREQLEHDRVIRLLQAKLKRKHDVAINIGDDQSRRLEDWPGSDVPRPCALLPGQEQEARRGHRGRDRRVGQPSRGHGAVGAFRPRPRPVPPVRAGLRRRPSPAGCASRTRCRSPRSGATTPWLPDAVHARPASPGGRPKPAPPPAGSRPTADCAANQPAGDESPQGEAGACQAKSPRRERENAGRQEARRPQGKGNSPCRNSASTAIGAAMRRRPSRKPAGGPRQAAPELVQHAARRPRRPRADRRDGHPPARTAQPRRAVRLDPDPESPSGARRPGRRDRSDRDQRGRREPRAQQQHAPRGAWSSPPVPQAPIHASAQVARRPVVPERPDVKEDTGSGPPEFTESTVFTQRSGGPSRKRSLV